SSTTTIPVPPQTATPAYRCPQTAAPLSPGLIRVRFVPATARTLATQLLSTTNRPVLSLQWILLRAAADRASAPGSPLMAAPLGPLGLVLTTAALTTESLPGRITTQLPRTTGTCMSPGTTSLPAKASSSLTPVITGLPGTARYRSHLPSSATCRSLVTWRAAEPCTSRAWTKAAVASHTTTPTRSSSP